MYTNKSFIELTGYTSPDRDELIVDICADGSILDVYTYADMPHPKEWAPRRNGAFRHIPADSPQGYRRELARPVLRHLVRETQWEKNAHTNGIRISNDSSGLQRGFNILLAVAIGRCHGTIPGGPLEHARDILAFFEKCTDPFLSEELLTPLRKILYA